MGSIMIDVKIIADSISAEQKRITTMQLKFHRFILPEFNTHRVFSRNASSSRAIPIAKILDQVKNDPAIPVHWGQNQPGMQARGEVKDKIAAVELWKQAAKDAASFAVVMSDMGLHKQVVNRILEPFQFVHVVVTSTEWDNFFNLRDHKDAQPEIQELAHKMKMAMDNNTPELLTQGEWHLPYVSRDEIKTFKKDSTFNDALKCSAARCARVSYMKHDGQAPSLEDDIELYNQLVTRPYTDKRGNTLVETDPIHASPIEHQATPAVDVNKNYNNFKGWIQHRFLFENQIY